MSPVVTGATLRARRPAVGTRRAALLLIALAAVAAPGAARADSGDGDGEAAEDEPAATVAVVVAGAGGAPLPPALQATVQVSMERALERDDRLEVVDQDDRLAAHAGRVPKDSVAEGLALLEAGETVLRRGKAKLALLKLQGASVQLARVLAWTSKQDLARAQLLLGSAQAMAGDSKAALATFAALQVWRPDAAPDPELGGSATLALWDKARQQIADADRGAIDLDTTPEGALAYVDGRLVGFTPTAIDGLTVGVHYVTIRREGFERRVEAVKVGARGPARLAVKLVPSERAHDLAAARTLFAAGIASPDAGDEARLALAEIGELVDVEQVVLVVPGARDGRYTAAVYATDGGARLATLDIKVGDRDLETAFAAAATKLYAQVATLERQRHRRPRRPTGHRAPPFYRRWWFWGGVAVVATAVAVPFLLPGDDAAPGCPTGNSCGPVIFRF